MHLELCNHKQYLLYIHLLSGIHMLYICIPLLLPDELLLLLLLSDAFLFHRHNNVQRSCTHTSILLHLSLCHSIPLLHTVCLPFFILPKSFLCSLLQNSVLIFVHFFTRLPVGFLFHLFFIRELRSLFDNSTLPSFVFFFNIFLLLFYFSVNLHKFITFFVSLRHIP